MENFGTLQSHWIQKGKNNNRVKWIVRKSHERCQRWALGLVKHPRFQTHRIMAGVRSHTHLTLWFLGNEMLDRERGQSLKGWESSLGIGGWIFLLDITCSRSPFIFTANHYFIIWLHHILLFTCCVDEHLGCFYFGASYEWCYLYKFAWTYFLGWALSIEISGLYSKYMVKFFQNCQFPKVRLYNSIFSSAQYENSSFDTYLPTLGVVNLWNYSHCSTCGLVSCCGFNLHFHNG